MKWSNLDFFVGYGLGLFVSWWHWGRKWRVKLTMKRLSRDDGSRGTS